LNQIVGIPDTMPIPM